MLLLYLLGRKQRRVLLRPGPDCPHGVRLCRLCHRLPVSPHLIHFILHSSTALPVTSLLFVLHLCPPGLSLCHSSKSPFPACSGYVIVAWIWSAIWYILLDPIKWALCWILNEDGFRDGIRSKNLRMEPAEDKGAPTISGAAASSLFNPLGRTSLSQTPAQVLDRKSASVVAITRDKSGAASVSGDAGKNLAIARKSLIKTSQSTPK